MRCNNPVRSRWQKVLLGWALIASALALGSASRASDLRSLSATEPAAVASATAIKRAPKSNKAKCGIRCLYAAALVEGVTIDGSDLVRAKYIGSREGSSIEELDQAARDHGLHTFAFINGTVEVLRQSVHPVIVHVESAPGSGQYDHYVLYLGMRGNDLLVLDTTINPGQPAQAISPRDLELVWDGAGVMVSKTAIGQAVFASSWREMLIEGGLVIGIVLAGKYSFMRWKIVPIPRGRSSIILAEMLVITTVSLAAPTVYAFCMNRGLLAHIAQIQSVEESHAADFLPRVSFPQAKGMLADRSAVFVDARYSSDYGRGHLPQAINLPVTASADTVRLYMGSVRTDFPIIVYCQSHSCPFSRVVATMLLRQGYTSVELLDGGWQEWSTWIH